MKITLRGKNIEITEAIEEKVSEKLSKLDKIEEKALYISKFNYDNEFKIYMEIWPRLNECVTKTLRLYPRGIENVPLDKEELEKYKENKYKILSLQSKIR